MEVQEQDLELAEHDTIDVEEDLNDIAALLAEDTVPVAVAAQGRRVGFVELVLVSLANSIWAVVGLVLWFPQALRAVLSAALRVIHSAMTHQRSDRAVVGIKQVSGLYFDRFLRRRGQPVFVGRRHELRPFRFLAETVWVVGFYLILLRWLAPSAFQLAWERLTAWWSVAATWLVGGGAWLQERLAASSTMPTLSWLQAGLALLAMAVLGALLGVWLGRRRR